MIQLISDLWRVFIEILNSAPLGFWTLLLAFGGSAVLTQRVKFWLPITWNSTLRAFLTQSIAFWSAVGITFVLWPMKFGLIAGGIIGVVSPTCYAIFVRILGKRYPDLRDLLSQDVREV